MSFCVLTSPILKLIKQFSKLKRCKVSDVKQTKKIKKQKRQFIQIKNTGLLFNNNLGDMDDSIKHLNDDDHFFFLLILV